MKAAAAIVREGWVPGGAWIRRVMPRPVRHAVSRALGRLEERDIEAELRELTAGSGPLVAGPWQGEVGFELLYWAPFLAWVTERFAVDPNRVTAISRGGTAAWYSASAASYLDVLDHLPPEAFRARHGDRVRELGEQKQTRPTAADRELVAALTKGTAASNARLLHPALMYRLLRRFWWGHAGPALVHRHVRYRRFQPPARARIPGLPASYIATKFYFNDCFPASAENRAFVRRTLEALAARGPVVSLSAGVALDDHDGCHAPVDGVIELHGAAAPGRNLDVQAAVVAQAQAFVGTYGGFAYLAPFYGVPSTGYYSRADGFARSHLTMAQSAFEQIGSAGLLRVEPARV